MASWRTQATARTFIKPLTTFPNLRGLRLLCPRESMRVCIIKPRAWEREWYAHEAPHKELPASWLLLRRWPQAGTEAHQRAKGFHLRAMAVLQELDDAWAEVCELDSQDEESDSEEELYSEEELDSEEEDEELDSEDEDEDGDPRCGVTFGEQAGYGHAMRLSYARRMR